MSSVCETQYLPCEIPVCVDASDSPDRPRTRVGLALSGGGARAMAHVGALRVIEKAGIDIDCIAATSAGALIALLYCCNFTPDEILEISIREIAPNRLAQFAPGGQYLHLMSLFRKGRLKSVLRKYIPPDLKLEDLSTPLYIGATNLVDGQQVVFDSGDALTAALATISIPGIAPPVRVEEMVLVDGAVLNNLPVDILRERSRYVAMGIDVSGNLVDQPHWTAPKGKRGLLNAVERSWKLYQRRVAEAEAQGVDILVAPDTTRFSFSNVNDFRAIADAGEAAARSIMPKLHAAVGQRVRGEYEIESIVASA